MGNKLSLFAIRTFWTEAEKVRQTEFFRWFVRAFVPAIAVIAVPTETTLIILTIIRLYVTVPAVWTRAFARATKLFAQWDFAWDVFMKKRASVFFHALPFQPETAHFHTLTFYTTRACRIYSRSTT